MRPNHHACDLSVVEMVCSSTCVYIYRLRDFSEWGQCQILDLLARYSPSNDEEVFDILVSRVHVYMMYSCIALPVSTYCLPGFAPSL